MIRFVHPEALLLLWLLIPFVGVYLYAARARRRAVQAFQPAARPPEGQLNTRPLIAACTLLGLAAATFAVARPGWEREPTTVERRGRDLVFVVDVSRSMLARDLAPDRLERARLAILDTVDLLHGDRVALVAFAGTAVVLSPLTFDYGFFRQTVERLSVTSVGRGGSLLGDALRVVRDQVFDGQVGQFKDLLLITDGGDHDSFPVQAAEELGQRGIRLLAVGLGDPDVGQPIPAPAATASAAAAFVEHEGEVVLSKLDADLLRAVAAATPGGRYVNVATGNVDLGRLYLELIAAAERRVLETDSVELVQERFQPFLVIALILLALALVVPELLVPRRRRRASNPDRQRRARPAAIAALVLAAGWWLGAADGGLAAGGSPELAARSGSQAYRAGDYAAAAAAYAAAAARRPEVAELLYDTGIAAYRAGDYATARASLEQAIGAAARPELAAAGHFALGNLLVRNAQQALQGEGDLAAAIQLLTAAIAGYQRALELDPASREAAHNLEVARMLLQELLQQQPPPEQQQQEQQQQQPDQDQDRQEQAPPDRQPEDEDQRQDRQDPQAGQGSPPPGGAQQQPSAGPQPPPPTEGDPDATARAILAAERENAERQQRQSRLEPVARDW